MTPRINIPQVATQQMMLRNLTKSFLKGLRRKHRLTVEDLSKLAIEYSQKNGGYDDPLTPKLIRGYENENPMPLRHLYIICTCLDEKLALLFYNMETCVLFHKINTFSPLRLWFFSHLFYFKHKLFQQTLLGLWFFYSMNRRILSLEAAI